MVYCFTPSVALFLDPTAAVSTAAADTSVEQSCKSSLPVRHCRRSGQNIHTGTAAATREPHPPRKNAAPIASPDTTAAMSGTVAEQSGRSTAAATLAAPSATTYDLVCYVPQTVTSFIYPTIIKVFCTAPASTPLFDPIATAFVRLRRGSKAASLCSTSVPSFKHRNADPHCDIVLAQRSASVATAAAPIACRTTECHC